MSYDLVMWRSGPDLSLAPQEVYKRLCEGERIDSLKNLPLDQIVAGVKERFPGVEVDIYELSWENGEESLQVSWSPQHVHYECHGPSEDTLARLVQIAAEFECSLYDPQAGELVKM